MTPWQSWPMPLCQHTNQGPAVATSEIGFTTQWRISLSERPTERRTMADEPLLRGPRAHSVKWTIDGDQIYGAVTCHCVEGADCRMTCPDGCEAWILTGHEHGLIDYGECLVVEWFDNVGLEDSHGPISEPLRDGFIDPEWDGDGWTWTYSAAAPSAGITAEMVDRAARAGHAAAQTTVHLSGEEPTSWEEDDPEWWTFIADAALTAGLPPEPEEGNDG
jgi:hypothetical protein